MRTRSGARRRRVRAFLNTGEAGRPVVGVEPASHRPKRPAEEQEADRDDPAAGDAQGTSTVFPTDGSLPVLASRRARRSGRRGCARSPVCAWTATTSQSTPASHWTWARTTPVSSARKAVRCSAPGAAPSSTSCRARLPQQRCPRRHHHRRSGRCAAASDASGCPRVEAERPQRDAALEMLNAHRADADFGAARPGERRHAFGRLAGRRVRLIAASSPGAHYIRRALTDSRLKSVDGEGWSWNLRAGKRPVFEDLNERKVGRKRGLGTVRKLDRVSWLFSVT